MKQKRRYYSLIDKVYEMENLYEAWLKVKKNKGSGGIDGVTIEMYEKNLNLNLREIQRLLQQNRYEPDPVLRHYIEKENGKLRPLVIPTIRERVCQQAVRQIIEPIFEQDFYYYSFGFLQGIPPTKPYPPSDVRNAADMRLWLTLTSCPFSMKFRMNY